MSASKHSKTLSVRLPEAELRRFKSLAAARGVSVQDAVHQALNIWVMFPPKVRPEPLNALEGSLADVDIESLIRDQKEAERVKDRRWF